MFEGVGCQWHVVAMKKITKSEWKEIERLAHRYLEAVGNNSSEGWQKSLLLDALENLIKKYPDDSRAYASYADYHDDPKCSFKYYEIAFNKASAISDYTELSSVSTSALRLAHESGNQRQFPVWKSRLKSLYDKIEDDWEKNEANDLLKYDDPYDL